MAPRQEKFEAIEIETERFRLVPIRPMSLSLSTLHWTKQTDALANMNWRTSGWTARRWWRHLRHQTRKGRQCHGIWPKSGGPCIGLHVLNITPRSRSALVGVFIGEREWWGKGVVQEARGAIIDDCFGRMKLERLWGQVHSRNLPSVYNHRKLGFKHEGTLRSSVANPDGTRMDAFIFGMLREDWLARQEGTDLHDSR